MTRQLVIPAADTRLFTLDTPGGEPPVVFLNGAFATTRSWHPVVARLAGTFRAVRFDARARGRSGPSADYSLPGAVDDVGRVVAGTGAVCPILVGWSHGATVAVRYAAQHPGEVRGLVLVDGAYPITMLDEAGRAKVHAQFRRLAWLMRVLAVFGRSARMSADDSADVVIEMDAANGALGPDFAALECPTVFVVGTGKHAGATDEEVRTMRAAVTGAEAGNPRVSVFATSPRPHTQILRRDPATVVAAIDAVIRAASAS